VIPPTDTAPVPSRSYDELMDLSMNRGRRLRRRRRMITTMPAVTALVAVGLIGIPSLMSQPGSGTDKVKVVTPANPRPSHSDNTRPTQPSRAHSSGRAGGAAPATAQISPGANGGQRANVPPPSGLGPAHQLSPATVTFDDLVGDGTPQGASAATASQPALDITKMTFTADTKGIRISMQLAGAYRDDGLYYAYFTDQTTGCSYSGIVGGAYHDSISWTCGTSSDNHYLPATVDPQSDVLVSYVPFDLMPAGVRSTDVFTQLHGTTYVANAANTQYDTASTTKVLKQQ
jgi:hypothetical protein